MAVKESLASAIVLGWLPVVAVLFRVVGPRRATLIGVFGGFLFLPPVMLSAPSPVQIYAGKGVVIGAGLALGILLFDRKALLRARPRWVDAPMMLFAVSPVLGLLSCGWVGAWDIADLIFQRTMGWLLPYAAGRLYFGSEEGPPRVGGAIVMASLCLAPVCLFEIVMGPRWYIGGLIYGMQYQLHMVERLGGWRPEGFFNNGITLASWMAMGSAVAFWLWLGRSWRPRWGPAWGPTAVLVATTLACRGVYGYVNLAVGLTFALLSQVLRTRWALVALSLLATTYMVSRASSLWDAHPLVELTRSTLQEKVATVSIRLDSENAVIAAVLERNAVVGFGNYIWHHEAVGAKPSWQFWPDGGWLTVLWEGGLLGLGIQLAALYFVPVALALSRPRDRPSRAEAGSAAWGLALFTLIALIDNLHNKGDFMPSALAAGSIVGWSRLGRARATHGDRSSSRPRGSGREQKRSATRNDTWNRQPTARDTRDRDPLSDSDLGRNLARFALVLALLATPEILNAIEKTLGYRSAATDDGPRTRPGHWPKPQRLQPPPLSGHPGGDPAKTKPSR